MLHVSAICCLGVLHMTKLIMHAALRTVYYAEMSRLYETHPDVYEGFK